MARFIESSKIKVTPCAYRNPEYDWEANVPTEYALTNLSGNGLRKSFRIQTESGDRTVKFILGNYYFTILDSTVADEILASTPWAHIELMEATVTQSSVSSLILKNQSSNNWDATNYCLDGDDGSGTSYFYGIQFFETEPVAGANKFNLNLSDINSYFITDASQIKAKPGTGVEDVDTASVVSNIIDGRAANSLKQVSASTVVSGVNAAAFGENTTATGRNQFVVGQNNASTNSVFIIGKGSSASNRSNAFEVGLDGSAKVANNIDIAGTATVNANLDVKKLTTLRGTVTVQNKAVFEESVDFANNITISNGNVTVSGGNITVSGGNVTINGAANFTSGLTVSSGSTSVVDITGLAATFAHIIANTSLNAANNKLTVSSDTASISTANTQIASTNIEINGENIAISAPNLDINSTYTASDTLTYALDIKNATFGDTPTMPVFSFRKNGEAMASIAVDGTITAKKIQTDRIEFTTGVTGEILDTKDGIIKTGGLKTDSITAANGTVTVDGDLSVTGSGNIEAAHDIIAGGRVSANNFIATSDITASGTISANNFLATSDVRLKKNVKEYLCEKSILDLPVIKYDYKKGSKNNIGCTAQDLQTICPELVHRGKDGYLQIEESKIVYLLLEEVKKLRKEVNELKK